MPSKLDEIEKQLPFLPGYRTNKNYHKKQLLGFADGVRVVLDPNQSTSLLHSHSSDTGSVASDVDPNADKQALRFNAFFDDPGYIDDFRRVQIYVFLVDETIQVFEPRIPNSGLLQGKLLRRMKVPKAPGSKLFVGADDFKVGSSITLIGREYQIVSCDSFTRNYFEERGVVMQSDTEYPRKQLATKSKQAEPLPAYLRITEPATHPRSSKKFIEHDGEVLRFYALWDDSASKYGQVYKMVIHYYLADDTLEVRKLVKGGTESFLRRHRVPKEIISYSVDGSNLSPTATNEDQFFHESDLSVGKVITVYGREVLICDTDEFTRSFYEKLGKPLNIALSMDNVLRVNNGQIEYYPTLSSQKKDMEVEETSALPGNREPVPKKRGIDESITLAFEAVMKNASEFDSKRRFIIKFYVVNDTFVIFEKVKSSVTSNKFLERGRLKNRLGEWYSINDLSIGRELFVYGRTFELVGTDAFTKKYLEDQ